MPPETYPLNKILRNRDKYLKRYRELKAQGKTDFAEKALQEASRWEAMLVEDVPPMKAKKPKKRTL